LPARELDVHGLPFDVTHTAVGKRYGRPADKGKRRQWPFVRFTHAPTVAPSGKAREERLLEHVLDVGRRQRGAQAGGQPRRVPGEQLAQCRVVTAGQALTNLLNTWFLEDNRLFVFPVGSLLYWRPCSFDAVCSS